MLAVHNRYVQNGEPRRPSVRTLLGFSFAFAYLLTAALPLTRGFLGPIPVYASDVLLVITLACILGSFPVLLSSSPARLVLVFAFAVVTSGAMVATLGEGEAFVAYETARRALAILAFFPALALAQRPDGLHWLRSLLVVGCVLHAALIIGQYALSTVSPQGLSAFDAFIYQTMGGVGRASRVQLWETSWYVPRAFGGYWNPNTAAAALLIPAPTLLTLREGRSRAVLAAMVIAAALLTGARQGILVLCALILARLLQRASAHSRRPSRLGALLLLASVLAVGWSYLPESARRAFSFVKEGRAEESLGARWGNYESFAEEVAEQPELLVIGRGVNFQNVTAHLDEGFDSRNVGFVSNTWLLIASQSGVVVAGLLVLVLVSVWRLAPPAGPSRLSILAVILLGFLDNHLATQHSLQVIFWVTVALVSAEAREQRGPMISSGTRSAARRRSSRARP